MNSLRVAARRIPAFTASTSASIRARVPNARAFGSAARGGRGTGQKAATLLKADIPKPEDPLLQYLSSLIMRDGHRQKANKVVALMLQHIHALTGGHPMDIFRAAVAKASPSVRVVSLRQGKMKVNPTPVPLTEKQRTRGAFLWIIHASMSRSGPALSERLAKEIVGIYLGSSPVVTWKDQQHAQAMVNRAAVRVPTAWEGR